MSKTVVLAVDVASGEPERNVAAAVEAARDLARDTGDKVIVLHVHEFAVGRFGRLRVDCGDGDGERVVAAIAARLGDDGVRAESVIREADYGHIAGKILATADEFDARMIVVGSRSRTDLPHLAFGSVSHRLLHLARRPVLVVPRQPVPAGTAEPQATAAMDA
jgi:nucleotide-binding universal stress UspA family protein